MIEDISEERPKGLPKWGWVEWVLIAQTALPALLLLPGSQSFRTPLRAAPYIIAFLPLFLVRVHRTNTHPLAQLAFVVIALLVLMLAHPSTPNLLAGGAHLIMSAAILSPLFWVPKLVRTPTHLWRVLLILLVSNGVNSVIGVLQVYQPDRWMPASLSEMVMDDLYKYSYQGLDGEQILRPPGLFDTPGAVCGAGVIAGALGLVVGVSPGSVVVRTASIGLSLAGVSVIYLTYVRASFIVLIVSLTAMVATLVIQGRRQTALSLAVLCLGILTVGMLLAVALAGAGITDRFSTLFESNPTELYYESRGEGSFDTFSRQFLNEPFGAGLGVWGMTAASFGGGSKFAEVQYVGWMLDGGILLVVLYSALILWEMRLEVRIASEPLLGMSGAAIMGLNAGVVILCLSFVPFASQLGLQFWLLSGALHGAARGVRV